MKKLIVGVSCGVVLFTALLYAGMGHGKDGHGDGPGMHGHLMEVVDRLGMTEAQKNATHEILMARHEAFLSHIKALASGYAEIFEQVHSEKFDEQAVRQACRTKATVEEELHVILAQVAAEVQGLLSPQQKVIAQGMKDEMSAHIQEHIDSIPEKVHGMMGEDGNFLDMLKKHMHGKGHGCGHVKH